MSLEVYPSEASLLSSDATYRAETGCDATPLVVEVQMIDYALLDRLDAIQNEPETSFANPQGLREHLRALRR